MKHYLVRVLIENQHTPPYEDYSSFSEVVALGCSAEDVDYSSVIFEDNQRILQNLLAELSEYLSDCYDTADNRQITRCVREIVKLENVDEDIVIPRKLVELDERLYTFDAKLTFNEFKERYALGVFAE